MGFYKPGANHPTDPRMARLHKIIWTLIFGGLLTLVLGIFVAKTDDAIGWMMIAAGGFTMAGRGFANLHSLAEIRVPKQHASEDLTQTKQAPEALAKSLDELVKTPLPC